MEEEGVALLSSLRGHAFQGIEKHQLGSQRAGSAGPGFATSGSEASASQVDVFHNAPRRPAGRSASSESPIEQARPSCQAPLRRSTRIIIPRLSNTGETGEQIRHITAVSTLIESSRE